jgi:S-adenosylmethionine:tRNA ribosyltransferase-isomerase
MQTSLFDFDLPDDRIALRPAFPRDSARLLRVRPGDAERFVDHHVWDLADLLRPGDALVVNDTSVIMAELKGVRRRNGIAAKISVNLHARIDDHRWRAFARPAKRLQAGDTIQFGDANTLEALVETRDGPEIVLAFSLAGAALDAAIASIGTVPLPPYIAAKRPVEASDRADYQTMFARTPGAVAAPTAGLHFTPDLLNRLAARGVTHHVVTLHVGAGTFLPMTADNTANHTMHAEWGEVTPNTAAALNATRAAGGRIVAVGTTSARLLESAAGDDSVIRPFCAETAIFITPGFRFKAVDLLMTNFHLPRSTLFMLVSAFSGLETMQAAYAHAIATGYRFYSYGDACLLERAGPNA